MMAAQGFTPLVCRMCYGTLSEFLDLDRHPLMNSLVTREELGRQEATHPLILGRCLDCGLVQLLHIVDAKAIYQDQDYLYYSSDMPGLREYFSQYAQELARQYPFIRGFDRPALAVEIGSNDGILLDKLKAVGKLGVEPAANVALRALSKNIPTISAFFTERLARSIRREYGPAQLIIGANCIAHIDDLHDVMRGVDLLLDDDGVFSIEANYWGSMMENTNYALVYLDHYSYFTLGVWGRFASTFGLQVFDAWVTPAQGGSLRLFMDRGKRPATSRLKELEQWEIENEIHTAASCEDYANRVLAHCRSVRNQLSDLNNEGNVIHGYGAAAKGLSMLRSAGAEALITEIVDDSPAKQGLLTPGAHIPVVSRDQAGDPDYFFILAPNYADVIIGKERAFLERGGRFLVLGKEGLEVRP